MLLVAAPSWRQGEYGQRIESGIAGVLCANHAPSAAITSCPCSAGAPNLPVRDIPAQSPRHDG